MTRRPPRRPRRPRKARRNATLADLDASGIHDVAARPRGREVVFYPVNRQAVAAYADTVKIRRAAEKYRQDVRDLVERIEEDPEAELGLYLPLLDEDGNVLEERVARLVDDLEAGFVTLPDAPEIVSDIGPRIGYWYELQAITPKEGEVSFGVLGGKPFRIDDEMAYYSNRSDREDEPSWEDVALKLHSGIDKSLSRSSGLNLSGEWEDTVPAVRFGYVDPTQRGLYSLDSSGVFLGVGEVDDPGAANLLPVAYTGFREESVGSLAARERANRAAESILLIALAEGLYDYADRSWFGSKPTDGYPGGIRFALPTSGGTLSGQLGDYICEPEERFESAMEFVEGEPQGRSAKTLIARKKQSGTRLPPRIMGSIREGGGETFFESQPKMKDGRQVRGVWSVTFIEDGRVGELKQAKVEDQTGWLLSQGPNSTFFVSTGDPVRFCPSELFRKDLYSAAVSITKAASREPLEASTFFLESLDAVLSGMWYSPGTGSPMLWRSRPKSREKNEAFRAQLRQLLVEREAIGNQAQVKGFVQTVLTALGPATSPMRFGYFIGVPSSSAYGVQIQKAWKQEGKAAKDKRAPSVVNATDRLFVSPRGQTIEPNARVVVGVFDPEGRLVELVVGANDPEEEARFIGFLPTLSRKDTEFDKAVYTQALAMEEEYQRDYERWLRGTRSERTRPKRPSLSKQRLADIKQRGALPIYEKIRAWGASFADVQEAKGILLFSQGELSKLDQAQEEVRLQVEKILGEMLLDFPESLQNLPVEFIEGRDSKGRAITEDGAARFLDAQAWIGSPVYARGLGLNRLGVRRRLTGEKGQSQPLSGYLMEQYAQGRMPPEDNEEPWARGRRASIRKYAPKDKELAGLRRYTMAQIEKLIEEDPEKGEAKAARLEERLWRDVSKDEPKTDRLVALKFDASAPVRTDVLKSAVFTVYGQQDDVTALFTGKRYEKFFPREWPSDPDICGGAYASDVGSMPGYKPGFGVLWQSPELRFLRTKRGFDLFPPDDYTAEFMPPEIKRRKGEGIFAWARRTLAPIQGPEYGLRKTKLQEEEEEEETPLLSALPFSLPPGAIEYLDGGKGRRRLAFPLSEFAVSGLDLRPGQFGIQEVGGAPLFFRYRGLRTYDRFDAEEKNTGYKRLGAGSEGEYLRSLPPGPQKAWVRGKRALPVFDVSRSGEVIESLPFGQREQVFNPLFALRAWVVYASGLYAMASRFTEMKQSKAAGSTVFIPFSVVGAMCVDLAAFQQARIPYARPLTFSRGDKEGYLLTNLQLRYGRGSNLFDIPQSTVVRSSTSALSGLFPTRVTVAPDVRLLLERIVQAAPQPRGVQGLIPVLRAFPRRQISQVPFGFDALARLPDFCEKVAQRVERARARKEEKGKAFTPKDLAFVLKVAYYNYLAPQIERGISRTPDQLYGGRRAYYAFAGEQAQAKASQLGLSSPDASQRIFGTGIGYRPKSLFLAALSIDKNLFQSTGGKLGGAVKTKRARKRAVLPPYASLSRFGIDPTELETRLEEGTALTWSVRDRAVDEGLQFGFGYEKLTQDIQQKLTDHGGVQFPIAGEGSLHIAKLTYNEADDEYDLDVQEEAYPLNMVKLGDASLLENMARVGIPFPDTNDKKSYQGALRALQDELHELAAQDFSLTGQADGPMAYLVRQAEADRADMIDAGEDEEGGDWTLDYLNRIARTNPSRYGRKRRKPRRRNRRKVRFNPRIPRDDTELVAQFLRAPGRLSPEEEERLQEMFSEVRDEQNPDSWTWGARPIASTFPSVGPEKGTWSPQELARALADYSMVSRVRRVTPEEFAVERGINLNVLNDALDYVTEFDQGTDADRGTANRYLGTQMELTLGRVGDMRERQRKTRTSQHTMKASTAVCALNRRRKLPFLSDPLPSVDSFSQEFRAQAGISPYPRDAIFIVMSPSADVLAEMANEADIEGAAFGGSLEEAKSQAESLPFRVMTWRRGVHIDCDFVVPPSANKPAARAEVLGMALQSALLWIGEKPRKRQGTSIFVYRLGDDFLYLARSPRQRLSIDTVTDNLGRVRARVEDSVVFNGVEAYVEAIRRTGDAPEAALLLEVLSRGGLENVLFE